MCIKIDGIFYKKTGLKGMYPVYTKRGNFEAFCKGLNNDGFFYVDGKMIPLSEYNFRLTMHNCEICNKKNAGYLLRCARFYTCVDYKTKRKSYRHIEYILCGECYDEVYKRKTAEFDGNTDLQDKVVCPGCGHEHYPQHKFFTGNYGCQDLFD